MKILITGVHGFVGSNLVRYLSPRHELYGVDIISPHLDGLVRTYSWDDMSNDAIPEVDAIVHLAGLAHDVKNQSAREKYFAVNRDLTVKAFDYFSSHGIGKFVFFSTSKAAADRVDDVLTEDAAPAPVGPYAESKRAAEEYILDFLNDHPELAKDKRVYIFRPCMIHGPQNKGNLKLLFDVVSKGLPWPLGAYDNRRTFTSIGNMCYAVEGVLSRNVSSGIYNMGDDQALSTNELIAVMCDVLGRRARIWKIPKCFINFAARIGDVLHLPLNSERLRKLTENYVSSNTKIKTALGVESMPVDARTGLTETIESLKNA